MSENAAQKRLSRAVERLREFFAKRGVTVGSSGLVVLIAANAVQAAPVGLGITISTAAALAGSTLVTEAAKTFTMTVSPKALLAAALVVAVTAPLILQYRTIQDLRLESARASELAAGSSREAALPPALTPAEADELERLRREHNELLRLRGEVSLLRKQLASLPQFSPPPVPPPPPSADPARSTEPVQVFVANADATVPAGQTLAFGGWATSPGKRTFIFVQPTILEPGSPGRVGTVFLAGRFIEVPDDVLTKMAGELNLDVLERIKATGKASSTHSLLTAEEAKLVLQTFENTAGVTLLSSPRIQTGDGVQATVSITEQKRVAGQEYTLGPTLDVEPRIASDGLSVNLTVSARLRQAQPAP